MRIVVLTCLIVPLISWSFACSSGTTGGPDGSSDGMVAADGSHADGTTGDGGSRTDAAGDGSSGDEGTMADGADGDGATGVDSATGDGAADGSMDDGSVGMDGAIDDASVGMDGGADDAGPAPDAGPPDAGPSCVVDSDCEDGVTCTIDTCTGGACVRTVSASLCVDDGLFCNGGSTCAPGAATADPTTGCAPTPAPDCSDAFACTRDACDESTHACVNTADATVCDDGSFCSGVERCAPGAVGADVRGCVMGTPPVCNDGVACTTDSCDATTDACVFRASDPVCSDAAFCNGVERCAPADATADTRGCVSGAVVVCNDGVACTDDVCDEGIDSCRSTPIDLLCSDGVYCDGNELCVPISPAADARGCVAGAVVSCAPDAYSCTVEACNESTTSCTSTRDSALCASGTICTAASGDPASGCTPGRLCTTAADCDDGNVCNGIETCGGGICRAGTLLNCVDAVGCTTDSCDPIAGCLHAPNDAMCDDHVVCDGIEVCDVTRDCLAGAPLVCSDGIGCTADVCSESAGGCTHAPSDAACSDGVFCDGAERCSTTLGCVGGPPPSCGDAFGCTDDACDSGLDACTHTPVSARCDDGAFCNGVETCSAATGCVAGTVVNCNDGLSCSVDSCNEAVDSCEHTYDSSLCMAGDVCTGAGCTPGSSCTGPTAGVCDDGQFCDGFETCSSATSVPGICQGGTAPNCNDGVACTIDSCSNGIASCTHVAWDRDGDGFADASCLGLGSDCNDLNPAIHPGAADICDGIDNNCDGLIDNGLTVTGGSCSVPASCCTGACGGGICTVPSGSCARTEATCTVGSDCCSGLCARGVDGTRRCQVAGGCSVAGVACTTAADCCSTGCVGGTCSDTATCHTTSTTCMANTDCCSNSCVGGTCAAAGPGCNVDGEVCSSSGSCCSGFCVPTTTPGVNRCETHDTCRAEGEICTTGANCCTGGCDASTHRCETLGSCSSSGEPCTGVRDCCSALCADGGSGVTICQHLGGCRPFGEICTANSNCCSNQCSTPDAVGVRRCVNPPGCVDAGEICGQGGSDDCCVLRHLGCTPTGIGVSRCNDMSMCIMLGNTCEFSEQCCSGAQCLLDPMGVRRCSTTCISTGFACLADSDCCAGGVCVGGFCNPSSSGCIPIGDTCTTNASCCSNVCVSGVCRGLGG